MKSNSIFLILFISLFMSACKQDSMPKPYGDVRLEYEKPVFKKYEPNCPFDFEAEKKTILQPKKENCQFNLYYPNLKATLYLTYEPVKNNLPQLLVDAEKSVYEPHASRAVYINPQIIVRPEAKVYGTLYELGGEAALNYQFHVTDSTQHFLRGAVYFNARPNPDSLAPAVQYMKTNVMHLMESLQWK
ncbi:gliding motility lipoprotein GldD [Ornithobacterium rhinotracheale]|uniref:Protein involved in gliding motility GldD n=2 Tax=Ornithobacterium rhinotracheale TaxID=28251 RepID=I4A265_ORNRL|nr:gliding motility lipoprotein GldD [Ornithobacterium rhinotracheale]AFL98049.1 protein involved in gliding motility GldD [Ornithobacterium rhinotracheale DSM 15997]AIP99825.1 gliding motility protein GldD [Ornithobacterium rhinotracheale ORT-UMN 88]MBN3661693.1 gliding motility lipoprotein GldD [Ornithobacterium rhinotracheale]MCK0193658.1 gliding motility lipoprotein GldD [Ornithobacterium rhinotracheale]MCK0199293.1 gliding motility lipoprotein GldD [Ornithobacterium rhinotracheale]